MHVGLYYVCFFVRGLIKLLHMRQSLNLLYFCFTTSTIFSQHRDTTQWSMVNIVTLPSQKPWILAKKQVLCDWSMVNVMEATTNQLWFAFLWLDVVFITFTIDQSQSTCFFARIQGFWQGDGKCYWENTADYAGALLKALFVANMFCSRRKKV